jgi:hypothetical protein
MNIEDQQALTVFKNELTDVLPSRHYCKFNSSAKSAQGMHADLIRRVCAEEEAYITQSFWKKVGHRLPEEPWLPQYELLSGKNEVDARHMRGSLERHVRETLQDLFDPSPQPPPLFESSDLAHLVTLPPPAL